MYAVDRHGYKAHGFFINLYRYKCGFLCSEGTPFTHLITSYYNKNLTDSLASSRVYVRGLLTVLPTPAHAAACHYAQKKLTEFYKSDLQTFL